MASRRSVRGRIVVLGETVRVRGYGLAGATVLGAEDAEAVRAAWQELPDDTVLVILTADAVRFLGDTLERDDLLVLKMPS